MIAGIKAWWHGKASTKPPVSSDVLQAYRMTFRSPAGAMVLTHLLESVYCTAYLGTNTWEAATHNGRRGLIQEILENIEQAERGTTADSAHDHAPVTEGAYGGRFHA